jgi:hypothetical protein
VLWLPSQKRDDGTNGNNGKIINQAHFRLFRYFRLFRHLFFFTLPQNPLVPGKLKTEN